MVNWIPFFFHELLDSFNILNLKYRIFPCPQKPELVQAGARSQKLDLLAPTGGKIPGAAAVLGGHLGCTLGGSWVVIEQSDGTRFLSRLQVYEATSDPPSVCELVPPLCGFQLLHFCLELRVFPSVSAKSGHLKFRRGEGREFFLPIVPFFQEMFA